MQLACAGGVLRSALRRVFRCPIRVHALGCPHLKTTLPEWLPPTDVLHTAHGH